MKIYYVSRKEKLKSRFMGYQVEGWDLWWDDKEKRWREYIPGYPLQNFSPNLKSIKSIIRHVRKHKEQLKGHKLRIINRFVGYDAYILL